MIGHQASQFRASQAPATPGDERLRVFRLEGPLETRELCGFHIVLELKRGLQGSERKGGPGVTA